jgi:hypothetical protein
VLPSIVNVVSDRAGEEPMYVPSASGNPRAPRQAELEEVAGRPVYVPSAVGSSRGAPQEAGLEEVAGRPVWVVYRPSAGLEVGLEGTDGDSVRATD